MEELLKLFRRVNELWKEAATGMRKGDLNRTAKALQGHAKLYHEFLGEFMRFTGEIKESHVDKY